MPIPTPEEERRPRRLIRDQAYDAIRRAILDGTFLPGEVLDDAALQRWLQISRTPIRQALYALTLEGLVETAPQAHTRVVRPRPEQALDYLQALGVMMVGVTALANEVTSADDRLELREMLARAIGGLAERDHKSYVSELERYFSRLNALCSNATLSRLVDQTSIVLGYNLTVIFQSMDVPWDELSAEYSALAAAWETGQTEFVEKATKVVFHLSDGQPLLAD